MTIEDDRTAVPAICLGACNCTPDMVPGRVWHVEYNDRELYGPSIDVCGWCGDSECDGIGWVASLDPDDAGDERALEQLHAWIRRGRYFEQVERVLAESENRTVPATWGTS